MKQAHLKFYVMEIQHQTAMARVGAATANAALNSLATGSSVQVFAGVQAILTAGALVSRLLWPDPHRDWSRDRVRFAKNRANELRRIIKPAPILQRHHRAVRNAIEHFDERLDQTFFEKTEPVLLDRNISPKSAMLVAENGVYLRHYDPETNTYSALASEISIQALVDALEAAEANATEWLHRCHTTQISRTRTLREASADGRS